MRDRTSAHRWLWILFTAVAALAWPGCGSDDGPSPPSGPSGPGSGGSGAAGGQGGPGGQGGATGGAGGVAGGGGAGGGGGGLTCGAGEKPCEGQCVPVDDPQYGCTPRGCAPCDAPNADAICEGGACAVGACAPGYDDCDGDAANGCEVQSSADPDNCGACGNQCVFPNATPLCVASACQLGPCVAPHEDCDGDPVNGCEAIVEFDPQNCGACNVPCAPGEQCQDGGCGVFCPPGLANCDGDATNGCETDLGTVSDCGFCNDACSLPNATPACVAGSCEVVTCDPGYANCDNSAANGCEVDTNGSALDCGGCGVVCPSGPHGTAVCGQGACDLVCDGGYEDCNGGAADGCEVATQTDVSNCGGCGVACTAPNGTPACDAGQCAIGACAPGHADCNGAVADGCEIDTTTSVANCGGCGQPCAAVPNGAPTCAGGACGGVCNPGFANCNMTLADGCEIDTSTSVAHCGGCNVACSVANGTPSCTGGACTVGSCNVGFADCNGNPADGCETNTQTSLPNCGGCGNVCTVANGTAACVFGACTVASCNAGVGDCNNNPADGCETSTNANVNHCGACGNACSVANGSPVCANGACGIGSCDPAWRDCNTTVADGCETNVQTSVSNCGDCNNACNLANATPACAGGSCAVQSCNSGWGNCNANPADGCEVNTQTSVGNCGGCGNACSVTNGTPACAGGSCAVASCNAGWGNCDGNPANGCETNTQTNVGNCGTCGNACMVANGTAACAGGSCVLAGCNAGWGNCDGNPANGCETNTQASTSHCGACGSPCVIANGVAACLGGTCAIASCNPGFADCDGNPANGCEVNTQSSVGNCGGCGNACSAANGTAACASGMCIVASCNPGWANCNGNPADGCETNTQTSVGNCGGCGNACSVANGTAACSSGACQVAGCNAGYANCNGSVGDGCEVNLQTSAQNCGGCGNNCGNLCVGQVAATSCSAGMCGITACNASYYNVDNTCSTGCECLSSGYSSSCNTPTSLGTIGLGASTTHTSNLVPAGKENWYTVTFPGNTSASYHPRVRFTSNPGNAFAFDIYSNCSGSSPACGTEGGIATSKTDWETFKPAANGYNNVIPPVGNNGTVLVRVFRKAGFPVTCDSFTLTISN